MLLQTGMKPQLADDEQAAFLPGQNTRLWLKSFGPAGEWKVTGPRDFGKSWIYRKLADAGEISWHTLRTEYTAQPDMPGVTVFVPVGNTQPVPAVNVERVAGAITVRLAGGKSVRFTRDSKGWDVAQ
jgi:hypothetical protein